MKNLASILLLSAFIYAAPSMAQAKPYGFPMPSSGTNSPMISNYISPNIQLADKGRILSLRDVAQIIDATVPGRISDAQLTTEGGRQVYLVRWEPSQEKERGRIIIFVVDAESGRILSRRGG